MVSSAVTGRPRVWRQYGWWWSGIPSTSGDEVITPHHTLQQAYHSALLYWSGKKVVPRRTNLPYRIRS